MQTELLEILRCPHTGEHLVVEQPEYCDEHIQAGWLVSESGRHRYPIRNFIPRFVPESNYADNFGLQWNWFRKTQLDSNSGHPISRDRFCQYTGWEPELLAGKRILDVGCDSGRFAEVALNFGAEVVALDYSLAVDACRQNLGTYSKLEVVQGDIYRLPFFPGKFDFVYCLGVLQHTPDVEKAFKALPRQLKPGGRLTIDLYPKVWLNYFWPKYWLRPLTKKMHPQVLFRVVRRLVPVLLPISRTLGNLPGIGRKARYLIPVANYEGVYPLSEDQLNEWSVLDTFDMFSPHHDHPQTEKTVRQWLCGAGLTETEVIRKGFIVGRGRAPLNRAAGVSLPPT